MKIYEWNMEFIVDVQSLAQHGKGKWWRSQPRWLVRGTKQALVKRRWNEHGTIYAISSDFGDQMTTQHLD